MLAAVGVMVFTAVVVVGFIKPMDSGKPDNERMLPRRLTNEQKILLEETRATIKANRKLGK